MIKIFQFSYSETGTHPIVFPDGKQIQEYAEFLVRLDSQDSQQVLDDDVNNIDTLLIHLRFRPPAQR